MECSLLQWLAWERKFHSSISPPSLLLCEGHLSHNLKPKNHKMHIPNIAAQAQAGVLLPIPPHDHFRATHNQVPAVYILIDFCDGHISPPWIMNSVPFVTLLQAGNGEGSSDAPYWPEWEMIFLPQPKPCRISCLYWTVTAGTETTEKNMDPYYTVNKLICAEQSK